MTKFSKILLVFLLVISVFSQEKTELDLKLTSKPLPFGLSKLESEHLPNVYLTLSGGGSRAISQLGVLKAFEDSGIKFDGIVGTSMGSIIGGLYAAGYSLDQLDSLIVSAPWNEFFSLTETSRRELFPEQKITEDKAIFSLRLDGLEPVIPTAINTGQRVSNFLNLLALNSPLNTIEDFDNFLFSYKAVSTNLVNGEPYVLDEGSLSLAMRASSSVSLVLEPVKIDSLILVDGGLIANNPVNTAKNSGAQYVVALDATSPLRNYDELKYPWEIADQIVSIPMRLINEDQLQHADFVLNAGIGGRKNTDFTALRDLIDRGYERGMGAAANLKDQLSKLNYSSIEADAETYSNLQFRSNDMDLQTYLQNKFMGKENIEEREIIYTILKYDRLNNFSDLHATINLSEEGDTLELDVTENDIVEDIIIFGAELIDADSILTNTVELKGRPFNGERVLNSLLRILREYRNQNYSLVRIENVEFDNNILRVVIDEQKIDSIEVEGIERTNVDIITRELPFEVGDNFIRSEIERGLLNLRSTNLFETIEIKIDQNDDKNNLIVSVKEKPSLMLRMGLRIDTEYFTQLSLDLRDENLLGTATELGVIFTGGIRNQSLTLEHRANRIFDTYLTYKIKGFYDTRDINTYINDSTSTERKFIRTKSGEYNETHIGGSIGIGAQFEKFGNVMIEGRYQQDQISSVEDFPAENEYTTNIAALRFSLSIDSQNKYPFPTKGVSFYGYYETAQSTFGSEVGYSKLSLNYKNYIQINDMHNMSFRFNFGYADETLPLSQHFSFGGQSSFLGFRDYSYRGRQIFVSSVEYRTILPFKIFFDTYVKARYDLGSIWNEQEQIRFKDLRHGIGASIALDTPIGPAEFSVGKSFLLKNTLPENIISWGETQLYFTIGYYY